MMCRAMVLALVLGAAPLAALRAQQPRTVHLARQLRDSAAHTVRLKVAVGHLALGASDEPLLYDARLRYDEARADAVHEYDAASRVVTLGMPGHGFRLTRDDPKRDGARMDVALTSAVPIELSIDGAAMEAELDVGRLTLTGLKVDAGAGVARVRFDHPNRTRMRELALDVSAGAVSARGLANANADRIVVEAQIGGADLDFGGEWTRDLDVRVDVTFGKVVLRVPRDVGVELTTDVFLASVERGPLDAVGGGRYVSANFDAAEHKLRVTADLLAGALQIRTAEP